MMGKRTLAGTFVLVAVLWAVSASRLYAQEGGRVPAVASAPTATAKAGRPLDDLARGKADFRRGNYEEALESFSKERVRVPQSAEAAYYLGMTFKKMQDFQNAAQNLKDAVMLQPPIKEAFIELADAYHALGRYDEALHALEVAERDGIAPAQTAYLRGLVLVQKTDYSGALTSFGKAKMLDPKLASSADFQIANVYSRQGREAEALALFNEIAAREPDSGAGEMAKQQAEALASKTGRKQRFSAAVNVQYQYDTNVILQPDSGPTTTVTNEDDTSVMVSVRASYEPELAAPWDLKFQYSFYNNAYSELSNFDIQSHTVGVTPSYRIGTGTAQVPVNWNYTLLDTKKYVQSLTVSPRYSFVTGENQQTQAFLRFAQKDFFDVPSAEEDRSGNDVGLGLSWYRLIAEQKGYLSARYELNKEDTKGENWSYLGNKISLGALYPVLEDLKLTGSLEASLQNFDNVDRKDAAYTANLQGLYAITPTFDVQLQYLYVTTDSTVDVYTYNKHVAGLGVYARF
jgi:tetratricopeptide (TPR) repeat protein